MVQTSLMRGRLGVGIADMIEGHATAGWLIS